jgi:hypothetical protein
MGSDFGKGVLMGHQNLRVWRCARLAVGSRTVASTSFVGSLTVVEMNTSRDADCPLPVSLFDILMFDFCFLENLVRSERLYCLRTSRRVERL